METNKQWKRVPFDIELAKKIQSGEIEGRIVTQGNEPVRIVCFDKKSTNKRETYQVVALVEINGRECLIICGENGLCWDCEDDCNRSLYIELPEETQKQEFKIGDLVKINIQKSSYDKDFIKEFDGKIYTVTGVNARGVCVDGMIREPQFFLNHEVELYKQAPKHEFKPFDKVLVKIYEGDRCDERWVCDIFSHIEGKYVVLISGAYENLEMIPYEGNEHLVGTTNNPE